MIKYFLSILFLLLGVIGKAQVDFDPTERKFHPFVAYEFGEAAFNKFQSLSGEIGLRFTNNHLLRIVHMNVKLTEAHLSSSFAGAINGSGVEGSFAGLELFYDFPLVWKTVYIGPSVAYYKTEYRQIMLDEGVKNKTYTLGLGLSYRERNLFGVRGLYYTLSIPVRLSLNPIPEQSLGDATITNSTFDNNIWLFIGYEF